MANDPFLGMLGLARRAGKLAFGDELVREACTDKKTRCVFVAADAGMSTAKKAAFYAESANVPLVTLPHSKDALGAAIGKNGCAVCAVTDIGLVFVREHLFYGKFFPRGRDGQRHIFLLCGVFPH